MSKQAMYRHMDRQEATAITRNEAVGRRKEIASLPIIPAGGSTREPNIDMQKYSLNRETTRQLQQQPGPGGSDRPLWQAGGRSFSGLR
jgi:hypothetical protein